MSMLYRNYSEGMHIGTELPGFLRRAAARRKGTGGEHQTVVFACARCTRFTHGYNPIHSSNTERSFHKLASSSKA